MKSETNRFLEWYEIEKFKGLIDIKFVPRDLKGSTVESFFEEVNRAINGEVIHDRKLL